MASSFCRTLTLLGVVARLLCSTSASFIVPGALYETGCAYPLEAIWNTTCPEAPAVTASSMNGGDPQFDLSGPEGGDYPPNINISTSLYRFSGLDQKLFTFTATIKFTMFWLDSRAIGQIADATNASLEKTCKMFCTYQNNGRGQCCDGIWVPTLNLLNAETGSVTTEDYSINAYVLPVEGTTGQGFVKYSLTINAVFQQPFDFHAFPFDRHALAVRVECIDCDFHKFLGYTDLTAYIGGWLQANNVPNADAASGYSGYNTSVRGPLGASMDGQAFPASSGWQLNGVNLVMANFTARDTHDPPSAQSAVAVGVPDFYGAVFMIYTQRITRVYYVLQTIIPPILLVMLGFTAFVTPRDRFPDRLRTLAPIMISVFVFQFTLVNILPSTYTLLAPHFLVFVSMVTVALLALVALTSYHIVTRQKAIESRIKQTKGRDKWGKKGRALFPSKKTAIEDVEEPPPPTLASVKSTMDPDMCIHCAKTAEEKQKEEEKKEKHEKTVTAMAQGHHKSRVPGYRTMRIWWDAMALDGVQGYRDHVAEIFERIALVIVFVLYAASLAALFGNASHQGANPNRA